MEVQTFDDVFDALSDTPAEAANMKARADLLAVLVEQVKSWGLPRTPPPPASASPARASTTSCAASSASSRWMPWSTSPRRRV